MVPTIFSFFAFILSLQAIAWYKSEKQPILSPNESNPIHSDFAKQAQKQLPFYCVIGSGSPAVGSQYHGG